LFLDKMSF